MRWVLSRRIPDAQRILLIESGKREVAERLIRHLRRDFGETITIDLMTCLPGRPENLNSDAASKIWRVTDYTDDSARWGLLREIRADHHTIAAVLYDTVPIMARWRFAALCLLPAKFLIANEHADYFWLDRGHFDHLVRFWMHRTGLLDESAARTIAQFLAFPFVLIYLVGYGALAHTVRLGRMALGKHRR